MFNSKDKKLTELARIFLEPKNATHRQYEALRSFFVDQLPGKEAAQRFGYSEGSFRVLVHKFRQNPEREFFRPPAKGPHQAPPQDRLRDRIVSLRQQNLSVYDISRVLKTRGHRLSPVSVSHLLKEEGFARLPRRRDDQRPPVIGPPRAEVADIRQLDLSPQSFRTKFGGLFLFIPFMAWVPFDQIVDF
jgi:transposase